jgi:hypothetical protein
MRRKSGRGILRFAQNDKAAARDGDFTELFQLLGSSEVQRAVDVGRGQADDGYLIPHDGEIFWGSDRILFQNGFSPVNDALGQL